jgi:hypothetical protein
MFVIGLRKDIPDDVLHDLISKILKQAPDSVKVLSKSSLPSGSFPVLMETFRYRRGFQLSVELHIEENVAPWVRGDLDIARPLSRMANTEAIIDRPEDPDLWLLIKPDGALFEAVERNLGDTDEVDIDESKLVPWTPHQA